MQQFFLIQYLVLPGEQDVSNPSLSGLQLATVDQETLPDEEAATGDDHSPQMQRNCLSFLPFNFLAL